MLFKIAKHMSDTDVLFVDAVKEILKEDAPTWEEKVNRLILQLADPKNYRKACTLGERIRKCLVKIYGMNCSFFI